MLNSILVHYSGGSDSSLALSIRAEKYKKVYLITYDRLSFIGVKDGNSRFSDIKRIYGSEKFIKVDNYKIGKWYKDLLYESYFSNFKKFKLASSVPCVPCKLSMHWHSIVYCIIHGIKTVADGTVPYMDLYPDQNRKITTDKLIKLYSYFGIEYIQPVYNIGEEVEQRLYDKGITKTNKIRGTINDKQVYCSEQAIFAFFVKYYIEKHGKVLYEKVLSDITEKKIGYMKSSIKEFIDKREKSFIFNNLLTNEEKKLYTKQIRIIL